MSTGLASNRSVTEAALRAVAQHDLTPLLLPARGVNQVQRGRATPTSLANAQQAVAAAERMTDMTEAGAPNSTAELKSATLGRMGPMDLTVTVTGDWVRAVKQPRVLSALLRIVETGAYESTDARVPTHESAKVALDAARRLVGALESQLAAQSGAETALYDAMERAGTATDRFIAVVDHLRER